MKVKTISPGAPFAILLSLAFAVSFCYGMDKTIEVVGMGECADCAQRNIKSSDAFSGLKVTINCKTANGELKTRASGELQEDGKFKVSLPGDMVKDGELKEECYAQLHSASAEPCPSHSALEATKIVSGPTSIDGKQTLGISGNLKFSPVTCTSACLWHHFKHKPWKKKFKHPFPKKPFPEPEPVDPKPISPPDDKPKPKPSPEPEPKPSPEPEPKSKKPQPEPEPKDKPEPKKPCPPFPKFPKFPKFPPKYFDHPKIGNYPPFPPYPPHP